MNVVHLGDVLRQALPARAGQEIYPILSMTMRGGLVPQQEKFKKSIASTDLSNYKVVGRGQLVVGFPIDEGVLSFQDHAENAIVSPAYAIWDISRPKDVHSPYLEKYLRSPRALDYYKAKLRGSTARRRSLPMPVFKKMPVPLPAVREQRRIADILDKADALRVKRRETIAKLDSLSQSIFHEMFGGAGTGSLLSGAISELVGGRNLVGSDDSKNSKRVLKISAVTTGEYLESESKPLPSDYEPDFKHVVHDGDVIISRANTAELVGASALVTSTSGSVVLPDKLWRAVPASGVDARFLLSTLQSQRVRSEISRRATGSGGSMKNISKPKLLGIPIYLPPLLLQQEFAERTSAVEQLKAKHRSELAELDNLFLSLQDRAFKGEL